VKIPKEVKAKELARIILTAVLLPTTAIHIAEYKERLVMLAMH